MRDLLYRIVLLSALLVVLGAPWGCGERSRDTREQGGQREQSVDVWLERSAMALESAIRSDDLFKSMEAESAAFYALDIDTANIDALHQLAVIRLWQQRFDDVVLIEHRCLEARPHESKYWRAMGDAFTGLGKYRSADSCHYEMYELDQGFESLVRVARREYAFGDYETAVSQMQTAIADAPLSGAPDRAVAAAHVELATMMFEHGETEPASELVEQALEIDPRHLAALTLKEWMLRVGGDYGASLRTARTLVGLSAHPRYRAILARSCDAAGEVTRRDSLLPVASREFERLSGPFPDAITPERIAFLLEWRLDVKKGLELAVTLTRHRRDVRSYDLMAWAYLENGHADLAWSSIGLALRKEARLPALYHRAAVIAKAAGKHDKYEAFARRARAINPSIEELYGPM